MRYKKRNSQKTESRLLRDEAKMKIADYIAIVSIVLTLIGSLINFLTLQDMKAQRKDEVNKTNAEFYHGLKLRWFTPDFREIITLLDMDQLVFVEDPSDSISLLKVEKNYKIQLPRKLFKGFPPNCPIFWIKNKKFCSTDTIKRYYTTYEMDDNILNTIDDLGQYFKSGIIGDTEYIYTGFGWYIETIWESKSIKQYIFWLRQGFFDENAHMHGFENMYWVVRSYTGRMFNHTRPKDYYYDTLVTTPNCEKGYFTWCRSKKIKTSTGWEYTE